MVEREFRANYEKTDRADAHDEILAKMKIAPRSILHIGLLVGIHEAKRLWRLVLAKTIFLEDLLD